MTPIEKLLKQRAILKSYLLAKLDVEDWHGIRDCCVDIEVIDAKLSILEELE